MPGERLDDISSRLWRPQALFHHSMSTSSQIDQLNAGGGIAVSFVPPARSPIHLTFDGSQSTTLSVWTTRSRYGFTSAPKLHSDLITVRFVTGGAMLRNNRNGRSFVGSTGWATFLSFEDMIEDRASVEFSALSVTLTRQALLTAFEALGGIGPRTLPKFVPVVEVIGAGMLALRLSVQAIHSSLQAGRSESDFIFPLMEEIIGYQIVSIWPKFENEEERPAEPAKSKSIELALAYIESRISYKMSIVEIANIAGVGVRSLQSSFRAQIGCTPFQYIINRRLEKVHEMLQVADEKATIRDIAMQWGFVHISDFGRRYRQRYGEAPKMARSAGRPVGTATEMERPLNLDSTDWDQGR